MAAEAGAPSQPPEGSEKIPDMVPPATAEEEAAWKFVHSGLKHKLHHPSWLVIWQAAKTRSVADAGTTALWEKLLSTFPSAACCWQEYAEASMKQQGNQDAVRRIFARCLLTCPYLPLWQTYLRFIEDINKTKGKEGLQEIIKAYDFALKHCGRDVNAGPLWRGFVMRVKSSPASAPTELSQRQLSARGAFHRALLAPVVGVERIWDDYQRFEQAADPELAKGRISDLEPKYLAARVVAEERRKLLAGIDIEALPFDPTADDLSELHTQEEAWKKLLDYERSNPLHLEKAALTAAMTFAYSQCLMPMYFCHRFWFDFASWHRMSGRREVAAGIYERGIKAVPNHPLLYFSLAEMEELHGRVEEAKAVFSRLLLALPNSELAHIQMMRFVRRTEGADAARKSFLAARKVPGMSHRVYTASAMLELAAGKDPKVARNVFELGLKRHISDVDYVLSYAQFLDAQLDEGSMRSLFERALEAVPRQSQRQIWDAYVECESKFGDLASLLKIEWRRKEAEDASSADVDFRKDDMALPAEDRWQAGSSFEDACQRYSFLGLELAADEDKSDEPSLPLPAAAPLPTPSLQSVPSLPSLETWLPVSAAQEEVKEPTENGAGGGERGEGEDAAEEEEEGGEAKAADANPEAPSQSPEVLPPPLDPAPLKTHSLVTSVLEPEPTAEASQKLLDGLPLELRQFIEHLPAIGRGPTPDVDWVIQLVLQAEIPASQAPAGIASPPTAAANRPALTSQMPQKRKNPMGAEGAADDSINEDVVRRPPAGDVFRQRQMKRARQAGAAVGGSGTSGMSGGSGKSGGSK